MKKDTRLTDFDLKTILEYEGFKTDDVKSVLACLFGENDGPSWHYVVELNAPKDGKKFVYLTGWCDATGWGCRDGSNSELASTALKAAKLAVDDDYGHKNAKQQLIAQIKGKQPYGLQI